MVGIYYITNIKNDKRYVGSSKDLDVRWCDHKRYLKNNKHKNLKLQRAWNKYGAEAFKFELEKILPDETTKEALLAVEQTYLDICKAHPDMWYNINYVANSPPDNTGYKHTDEAKAKISKAHKGKKHGPVSEETKAKISETQKGIKHGPVSEETKAKISNTLKGRKHGPMSEEQKLKLSKVHMGRKKGPFSEEHKLNMSKAKKGMKFSEERKLNMSKVRMGVKRGPRSEETRAKISLALMGNQNGKKSSKENQSEISIEVISSNQPQQIAIIPLNTN